MMLRKNCLFILSFFLVQLTTAQDAVFSQFFAIPNALNPALSGVYDGKYRVSGVYRDQWRSVMDEPFRSFGLGLDLKFEVDQKGFSKDFFGVSMGFQTDQSGFIEYSLNQMWLGGAFHKYLGKGQYLGGGFQIGMNQRNINYSKINFQDQFNGIDGYTLGSLENLPENNFAHGDFAAGINFLGKPNKQVNYTVGISIHHFLGIENSFFKRDSRTEINTDAASYNLPARINFYTGMQYRSYELLVINPRILVSLQNRTVSSILGCNFTFDFLQSDKSSFTLGPFLRLAAGKNGWSSDMAGILTGYGYDNLFIGMSYDFSLNAIQRYGRTKGTFELSISYFGFYENNDIFCPTF
jgi:type IX secretion system PorP/SprF family membrane protein